MAGIVTTDWTHLTAADVMTKPVMVLNEASSLEEAIRILSDEEISGAPVIDARGHVVGVITLADVAMYLAGLEREIGKLGDFYTRSALRWDRTSESWSNLTEEEDVLRETRVSDVMTADIVSVRPATSLPEVIVAMHEREVHRVVVLDDGRLSGLITTMDVLGALRSCTST